MTVKASTSRTASRKDSTRPDTPRAFPSAVIGKPTEPWVPKRVVIHPVATSKTTRRKDKLVKCWDVRGSIDGWPYFKRFTQPHGSAEQARSWAKRLVRDFHRGWTYDPKAHCFFDPSVARTEEDDRPTVFDCTLEFLDRKWELAWEPKSRQAAVRALKRACIHLLRPEAPQSPPPGLRDYLDEVLVPKRDRPAQHNVDTDTAERWLRTWSKPIGEVTWQELEALVAHYRQNQRNGAKRVSASTECRFVADLKNMWGDAAARHGFTDPWPAVRRAQRSGERKRAGRLEPVEKNVVLSPAQLQELAEACVEHGSWGEVVRCYVLVMGLCGLRPSEAVGITVGDVELPEEGPGWLAVRQSRRRVGGRWLEPDEDPEWGPLKDRAVGEQRRVPVTSWLAPLLREHMRNFCTGNRTDELVFQRLGHPFDLSAFDRDVWQPGRAATFPSDPRWAVDDPRQPRVSRLRRHDLRHAACSLWLNAGVDAKVCQAWSGHKTLSAFLDIYQGIMPGREDEGVRSVDNSLSGFGLTPNHAAGPSARATPPSTSRTSRAGAARQARSRDVTRAPSARSTDRRSKVSPGGPRRSASA